ncbi:MAG: hypothetical protein QW051_00865 [Candidatus Aenigmatarchaeota archaeon]
MIIRCSENYNPNLILTIPRELGKYTGKSLDQIPLLNPDGFSYLEWLKKIENISPYDLEQLENVIGAYSKFPVKVRCIGKNGECDNETHKIILPFERAFNPYTEKEFNSYEIFPNFLCKECAEDYKDRYIGGREKGVLELPLSFKIFEHKYDYNRKKLLEIFRRIAFAVLTQGLEIDTKRIDYKSKIIAEKEICKEIVNTLLGARESENRQLALFGDLSKKYNYKERDLYIIKGNESCPGQIKLNF